MMKHNVHGIMMDNVLSFQVNQFVQIWMTLKIYAHLHIHVNMLRVHVFLKHVPICC